jgi:hypothetical protein
MQNKQTLFIPFGKPKYTDTAGVAYPGRVEIPLNTSIVLIVLDPSGSVINSWFVS